MGFVLLNCLGLSSKGLRCYNAQHLTFLVPCHSVESTALSLLPRLHIQWMGRDQCLRRGSTNARTPKLANRKGWGGGWVINLTLQRDLEPSAGVRHLTHILQKCWSRSGGTTLCPITFSPVVRAFTQDVGELDSINLSAWWCKGVWTCFPLLWRILSPLDSGIFWGRFFLISPAAAVSWYINS